MYRVEQVSHPLCHHEDDDEGQSKSDVASRFDQDNRETEGHSYGSSCIYKRQKSSPCVQHLLLALQF